jgi:hypothetical protein
MMRSTKIIRVLKIDFVDFVELIQKIFFYWGFMKHHTLIGRRW